MGRPLKKARKIGEPLTGAEALEAKMGKDAIQVYEWRVEQLTEAGVSPAVAHDLAAIPDFDQRKVCQLIKAGCDPELAVEIVR